MTPTERADDLRRRSRHLRDLARAIEGLAVLRLDRHAGEDTWRGRRPALCLRVLGANQHQLLAAADELRATAWDFSCEADRLYSIGTLDGSNAAYIAGLTG